MKVIQEISKFTSGWVDHLSKYQEWDNNPGASRLGKRKKPVNPDIGSACLFYGNSPFFLQLKSSFEKKKVTLLSKA